MGPRPTKPRSQRMEWIKRKTGRRQRVGGKTVNKPQEEVVEDDVGCLQSSGEKYKEESFDHLTLAEITSLVSDPQSDTDRMQCRNESSCHASSTASNNYIIKNRGAFVGDAAEKSAAGIQTEPTSTSSEECSPYSCSLSSRRGGDSLAFMEDPFLTHESQLLNQMDESEL